MQLPLVRTSSARVAESPPQPPLWGDEDRIRKPGSDWLYLTLPGRRGDEDAVLAGPVGELADRLVADGDAEGWFFVRYDDPRRHLRIRLHGAPAALLGRVLPALSACAAVAVGEGVRDGMAVEIYERELERYGGPATTAVCETIACADSTAVRQLLRAAGTDQVELGVLSTAALVLALATGPDEARRWCAAMAPPPVETGRAFRERGRALRGLVAGLDRPGGDPVLAVLARRTAAVAPLAARLRTLHADGSGTRPIDTLVPSITHLHANRLGLDRRAERLVLGLLDRTLRSLAAHPPGASASGEGAAPA